MQLIVISGLSGSGKSIALNVLEDSGYYCVDNLPVKLLAETVQLLHTTFVTPFDRDDIHRLISRMDDVLDLIQDTAESLVLYDIQKITPEATQLAELLLRCSERWGPACRNSRSSRLA